MKPQPKLDARQLEIKKEKSSGFSPWHCVWKNYFKAVVCASVEYISV
jgi:hypothetical protein